jgi:hypothetical protein
MKIKYKASYRSQAKSLKKTIFSVSVLCGNRFYIFLHTLRLLQKAKKKIQKPSV